MSTDLSLRPPRRSVTELKAIAQSGRERFDDASDPIDILAWFGTALGRDRVAVATSFADAMMATLAARALPGVDLLFVDTGYHFAETLGLRDAVAAGHDVEVRTLRPELTVAEQDHRFGERLWQRDPDACCAMRKRAPIDAALRGYEAWATGLRRADHPDRESVQIVEWDERREMIKVNPLAAFSDDQIDACVTKYDLLVNPLVEVGYASIGCSPCTRPVDDGEHPRAGRWSGNTKTECGLHM